MARRLAAILAADVVGYSRLMAVDEAGTHARLEAPRQDLIEPKIGEHHGRIVKLMGDGALVEFASVVDAVQCAVEIQQEIAERNAGVLDDQRIQFRLGVNLGDVIIEGDDIYGDGVNVAARLEALAEPGSVCVSAPVRVQVEDKLPYGFDDLGEQRVKNILRPVHVFRVVPDGRGAPAAAGRGRAKSTRRLWPAAAAVVALLIGAAGAWLWHSEPAPQQAATTVATSEAPGGAKQAPLDKYRIAVLPFANISADPEDEYFSDGTTEELISKLSRLRDLSVIARTSTMQYKGTGKGIAEIGRELQVGTILEGSSQGRRPVAHYRAVDRRDQSGPSLVRGLRRDLTDVFAIQSDVAQNVAQALQITLKPAETRQLEKAGTADLEAYNAYLKGLYHFNTMSKEGLEQSIEYFEQATTRDPAFAKAYAALAFSYDMLAEPGYRAPDEAFPKVKEAAHRALEIDATTAEAYTVLASVATFYDRDWIRADEGYRRALELNPNSAIAHDWYGAAYLRPMGGHDEAIAHGQRAKELDPLTPYMRVDLGFSYNFARRYDNAIAECKQIVDIDPNFYFTYWCLGYAYWQKVMLEEAIAAYHRGVELNPGDLRVKAHLAMVYADAGDKVRAQQILEELEEKARREYVPAIALAWAHMAVGDLEGAFASMDEMYEQRDPELLYMNVHLIHDGLRGDPRFHELMRKIGFTEAQIDQADALAGKRD
jgi:class 3 adenylate cyclase/TolB-like protein/Tfp pilus assembly protein PilF